MAHASALDLSAGRRLQAAEPAFAAEVVAWEERLVPLFNEIAPVEPGPELWGRIERAIARNDPGGEIIASG